MIRKLAGCVRQYKKSAVLTPVFVVCESIIEVIIPLVMAALIDNGIEKGDMKTVVIYGVALLLLAGVCMTFGALAGREAAVASSGFARNLRKDMYDKVQTYSFSNIDKFSSASIVTRMTTDVTNVQMAFQMIIRGAMRSPAMMIFSLVVSFRLHAGLSLIFLAAMPVLAIALYIIMQKAHPVFQRVFKVYDRLNRTVQENVRGIRVVKSFVREKHETEKFEKTSEEIYRDFTKAEKTLAFNAPVMQLCMYACTLLVSWIGAKIIVLSGATELTTGQLTSLITYATQILMSLMMISMIFVMITISRASAERITEILDEQPDLTNPENPVMTVQDGSVCFENVRFSYGKRAEVWCLENVNLTIPSGATVGILGGTGSSKSTLVQLIPRLYDTTEGCVRVGGVDVKEYDLDTLRNSVAMVLQKNVLFSGTIKENLRWGNENATDEEIRHACHIACADEFIEQFPDGYDTYIEQGGANVSGGQKQRLCIARALLKKPKILILDDSTSAVDTRTDAFIRQAMRDEIPNTTKFIIAQRVASVQEADMILVLDAGHIVACGQHEELLASCEIYREVYESQTKDRGEDA